VTLQPGARLGPYEVVSALGAGGMGEVYRARDTRLGRDVAVKVLPAGLSADPERLQRFGHETVVVNWKRLHHSRRRGVTPRQASGKGPPYGDEAGSDKKRVGL